MVSNFHTHTTFCDGKNTPEEVVICSIEKGFECIGFSGHGYTGFDLTYCVKDMQKYVFEINRLKEKYKNKIQIYLGVEEDAFNPLCHEDFDYVIGSSHYLCAQGKYYPIDLDCVSFKNCLKIFDNDIIKLAEAYYCTFCEYILKTKPDIIGHFDLITKFDEADNLGFLCNEEYNRIAEKYITEALKSEAVFEVNTGAISRGLRSTPYPAENLLYTLKKHGGKVMLSSDSHSIQTLDFYFDEAKQLLRDIGFECVYGIYDGEWKKYWL